MKNHIRNKSKNYSNERKYEEIVEEFLILIAKTF